ncbi:MAG: hypothetical protein IPN28_03830 [Alphaproteobacteria bacterium]|nr:MAG: hypothetical protein IPN28_03830 [Alphaproteobacteria bacterium]
MSLGFHFVFVHGWGNGPDFWDKTAAYFWDIPKTFIDLGFIKGSFDGLSDRSALSTGAKKVYVTHSLGTLWALKNRHMEMSALIAINGFYNFRVFSEEEALLSMKQRLTKDPIPQMGVFWRRCGIHPENSLLDLERLQEGMNWLIHDNATKEIRNLGLPVLSLTAKDDPVLPIKIMRQHWSGYPLQIRELGGHSLPWSEPRWCSTKIMDFIDGLRLEK